MRRTKNIFYFLVLSLSQLAVAGSKTCVISWLGDSTLEKQIIQTQADAKVPGATPEALHLITGISGTVNAYANLKACLEGDFEEVILIAHAREEVPGRPSILFPETTGPDGQSTYSYLNDRIFTKIKAGPKLKLFTIAVCQAELVLKQYGNLKAFAKNFKVEIRSAPTSPFATWYLRTVLNPELGAVVPLKQVMNLVAEAAQKTPEPMSQAYCYLYRDPVAPGVIKCAHDHLRIHLKNSSAWHSGWAYLRASRDGQRWWIVQDIEPRDARPQAFATRRRRKFEILKAGPGRFANGWIEVTPQK